MASGEQQVADNAAEVEEQADADFDAGFSGSVDEGATETPALDPNVQLNEDGTPVAAATPAPAPAPGAADTPASAPAPASEPKMVSITEEELTRLRAGNEKLTAFDKKFDQVFGKVGQLEQVISKLRTETPAGEAIALSEEDFGDLAREYPEIARYSVQGLNKALAKFRGTGGMDSEAIDKVVNERVAVVRDEVTSKMTDAVLNIVMPGWRQQVATKDFDSWLKAQPADVQQLAASDDVSDAAAMLRLFDKHRTAAPASAPTPTPAPAPGSNSRQRQIAAAVTPRGDGRAPAPAPAQDEFEAGFKTG